MKTFAREFRYMFLGFLIGSAIQLPYLIATRSKTAIIVQSIIFVIAAPMTYLGFKKEK